MFQKEFVSRFNNEILDYCKQMDKTLNEKKFFNKRIKINELTELIYTVVNKCADFQLFIDVQQHNYLKNQTALTEVWLLESQMNKKSSNKRHQATKVVNWPKTSSNDENLTQTPHKNETLIKTILHQDDVSRQVHLAKMRAVNIEKDLQNSILLLFSLENKEKDIIARRESCKLELINMKNQVDQGWKDVDQIEIDKQKEIKNQNELLQNLDQQQKVNQESFKQSLQAAEDAGKRELLKKSGDVAQESARYETLCNSLSSEAAVHRERISSLKAQRLQLQAKLQLLKRTNQQAANRLEKNYNQWVIGLHKDLKDAQELQVTLKKQLQNLDNELYYLKKAKDEAELKELENQSAQTLNTFIYSLKEEIQTNKQLNIQLGIENKELRDQLAKQQEEKEQLLATISGQNGVINKEERDKYDATFKIIHQLRQEIAIFKQKIEAEAKINQQQRDMIKSRLQSSMLRQDDLNVEEQLQTIQASIAVPRKQNQAHEDVVDIMQQRKNYNINKLIQQNNLREQQQELELHQKRTLLQSKISQVNEKPQISDKLREAKKLLRITKRNSSFNLLLVSQSK